MAFPKAQGHSHSQGTASKPKTSKGTGSQLRQGPPWAARGPDAAHGSPRLRPPPSPPLLALSLPLLALTLTL